MKTVLPIVVVGLFVALLGIMLVVTNASAFLGNSAPGLLSDPIAFDVQGHQIGEPQPEAVKSDSDGMAEAKLSLNPSDAFKKVDVRLTYMRGRLAKIEMDFDSIAYLSLRDAYSDKYGNPHRTDRDGSHWQTKDGEFHLEQTGHAWLWGAEYSKHIDEELEKDKRRLRNSL